ncbi:MAG: hypothetical protein QM751_11945 [Paludibacteraceae bacterium]
MNKIYQSLLISTGLIVVLTVAACFVLKSLKYEISVSLAFLPVVTLSMMGSLALISNQYLKKDKILGVIEILVARILFLIPFIVLFIVGILMNKNNIVPFTILFVLYYLVFAVTETRTLMKLTKKEI